MQDIYDLLHDVNSALSERGLPRIEETVRPAIFSGIVSDVLSASLAKHGRVLTQNLIHNGHPDLIPEGRYTEEILLARLTLDDYRRDERGEFGTRTASPNRSGVSKLRSNWVYREAESQSAM